MQHRLCRSVGLGAGRERLSRVFRLGWRPEREGEVGPLHLEPAAVTGLSQIVRRAVLRRPQVRAPRMPDFGAPGRDAARASRAAAGRP